MSDSISHTTYAVQNSLNSIRNQVPHDNTVRFDVTKTGVTRINPLSGNRDNSQVESRAAAPFPDAYCPRSPGQSRPPASETLAKFGHTVLADTDHLTAVYTCYIREGHSHSASRETPAQTVMTRLEVASQTGYIIPRSVRGRFLDEFEQADEVTVTSELSAALWGPFTATDGIEK